MWRVMTGRNESVERSFMLVGHTKFAPDRFFGLIKKKFKVTLVSTLEEIKHVVRRPMLTGQNIPQGTKTPSGNRLVTFYDWKTFLSAKFKAIPRVTSYHHFRLDEIYPGTVFVRDLHDSSEVSVTLCSKESVIEPSILPLEVIPKGMDGHQPEMVSL